MFNGNTSALFPYTKFPEEQVGHLYETAIQVIKDSLTKMETGYFDSFLGTDFVGRGYEFAGFVFFQGFSDMHEPNMKKEYEYNLFNLINDIRSDLHSIDPRVDPDTFPFVIGELGMHGILNATVCETTRKKVCSFRQSQWNMMNATKYPQFQGNVLVAPVAPCIVKEFAGHFHYSNRYDHYYCAGQSMASTLLKMMR